MTTKTDRSVADIKIARVEAAKASADALGARVQRKVEATRGVRSEAEAARRRDARQLRKELRVTKVTGEGPTPHTRRQRRDSGLQAMMNARLLTPEMVSAAQEIERVFHTITLGLGIGSRSLEPRVGGERQPMVEKIAWAYAKRYKPWADELSSEQKRGGAPALAITIAIVIDDMTMTKAESEFRMRRRTVQFWVRRSLARYAEIQTEGSRRGLVAEVERENRAR